MKTLKPVYLEVVSKMLTVFHQFYAGDLLFEDGGLRKKYRNREINEYPDDLKEEVLALSEWIRELSSTYQHRLVIRVIDAQSLLGLYKSIRHRFRQTPTFIVSGKETYTGWDKAVLETILDRHLDLAWGNTVSQPS
ncbi:MAG: hypothetical protein KKB20_01905 [Proteobacteria bacterium]|nr:hypothetical protein [Pseudomonadota bacterium]